MGQDIVITKFTKSIGNATKTVSQPCTPRENMLFWSDPKRLEEQIEEFGCHTKGDGGSWL